MLAQSDAYTTCRQPHNRRVFAHHTQHMADGNMPQQLFPHNNLVKGNLFHYMIGRLPKGETIVVVILFECSGRSRNAFLELSRKFPDLKVKIVSLDAQSAEDVRVDNPGTRIEDPAAAALEIQRDSDRLGTEHWTVPLKDHDHFLATFAHLEKTFGPVNICQAHPDCKTFSLAGESTYCFDTDYLHTSKSGVITHQVTPRYAARQRERKFLVSMMLYLLNRGDMTVLVENPKAHMRQILRPAEATTVDEPTTVDATTVDVESCDHLYYTPLAQLVTKQKSAEKAFAKPTDYFSGGDVEPVKTYPLDWFHESDDTTIPMYGKPHRHATIPIYGKPHRHATLPAEQQAWKNANHTGDFSSANDKSRTPVDVAIRNAVTQLARHSHSVVFPDNKKTQQWTVDTTSMLPMSPKEAHVGKFRRCELRDCSLLNGHKGPHVLESNMDQLRVIDFEENTWGYVDGQMTMTKAAPPTRGTARKGAPSPPKIQPMRSLHLYADARVMTLKGGTYQREYMGSSKSPPPKSPSCKIPRDFTGILMERNMHRGQCTSFLYIDGYPMKYTNEQLTIGSDSFYKLSWEERRRIKIANAAASAASSKLLFRYSLQADDIVKRLDELGIPHHHEQGGDSGSVWVCMNEHGNVRIAGVWTPLQQGPPRCNRTGKLLSKVFTKVEYVLYYTADGHGHEVATDELKHLVKKGRKRRRLLE